ncbi:hypothetical protein EJQ19_21805 [Paenibacillus whitsoniae]|uniref:Uncharacterized protein n=1 Tax=Paenibacillus whitsoniae TaxID=2496558 RepID=A0A430J9Q0_9BACL|nr:hypothetical protein EJQ19_21805 [Paenibacillus whitsoniae]
MSLFLIPLTGHDNAITLSKEGVCLVNSLDVKRSKPVSPIIASIPHGSSQITPEMLASKKPEIVLSNNDWFLNELYSFLERLNITTVSADYSRYVIDVNREISLNNRAEDYTKSLVYQKSTFGRDLYDIPLSEETILNRIETIIFDNAS